MDRLQNTIVNFKWTLKKKLSQGSFGVVYSAQDMVNKEEVFVNLQSGRSQVGKKRTGRGPVIGERSPDPQ